MKKNNSAQKFKKALNQNKILINIIIICVGLISAVIGFFLQDRIVVVSQLLIEIGISILTSGFVALFAILAIDDADDDSLNSWGLADIYKTRSQMNSHTAEVFPEMKKEYQQIAFGIKSLRDAYDTLFVQKAKKGLKIKIITMHPNSLYLKEREKVENKQEGEIRKTIIDLIAWIEKLQSMNKNGKKNIQIKFYDSTPLDFYCKIDDNLYIGPYLYGKESQQTISYRFNSDGDGYKYYTEYFNMLWNSDMMISLETVKEEIQHG